MNKAVFLDRDGTINIEKNYLYKTSEFQFLPGAVDAIRNMNRKGYKIIIITNQAGVARGYYTEQDVENLNEWMKRILFLQDVFVDDIFYCPHHSEYGSDKYRIDCDCRKPRPGLIKKAIEKHNICPNISFTIGDKESDISAGKSVGTKTILVRTGYGSNILKSRADFICKDLLEAAVRVIT